MRLWVGAGARGIALILCSAAPILARQLPAPAVMWQDRGDPSALDIINGVADGAQQPGTTFTFVKETKSGTSPKLWVVDERGVRWKAKLGAEVQSETAASRLVWAAGYFVDVMTNGFGVMPDYRMQVTPDDRWRIAAYIRVLQVSRQATTADVPAAELAKLEAADAAAAAAPAGAAEAAGGQAK